MLFKPGVILFEDLLGKLKCPHEEMPQPTIAVAVTILTMLFYNFV